jgi:hypothetical protein
MLLGLSVEVVQLKLIHRGAFHLCHGQLLVHQYLVVFIVNLFLLYLLLNALQVVKDFIYASYVLWKTSWSQFVVQNVSQSGFHILVQLVEQTATLTLAPLVAIFLNFNGFVLVVGIKPRINLQKPLQNWVLNRFVNKYDELEVLVQQLHPLLHKLSVPTKKHSLWRKFWQVVCRSVLQIIQQALVHLVEVVIPLFEDPNLGKHAHFHEVELKK